MAARLTKEVTHPTPDSIRINKLYRVKSGNMHAGQILLGIYGSKGPELVSLNNATNTWSPPFANFDKWLEELPIGTEIIVIGE